MTQKHVTKNNQKYFLNEGTFDTLKLFENLMTNAKARKENPTNNNSNFICVKIIKNTLAFRESIRFTLYKYT